MADGSPPSLNHSVASAVDPEKIGSSFDLTWEEVRAYVGERCGRYYYTRWRRAAERGSRFSGFNWAAGLFNVFWLMYRRMYRESFLVLGIRLALEMLTSAIQDDSMYRDVTAFTTAGLVAVMGIVGNGLYLRKARLAIAAARREGPDPERRAELLRRSGGTRRGSPVIAVGVILALNLLLMAFGS